MKKVIGLGLLLMFALVACGDNKESNIIKVDVPDTIKEVAKYPVGAVKISTKSYQTYKGLNIYGETKVSDTEAQLMVDGIEEMYRLAFEDGFSEKTRKPMEHYVVFTPPYDCLTAPESGVKAFLINAGSAYDGTIYDQHTTQGKYRIPVQEKDYQGNVIGYLYSPRDDHAVVYAPEMVLGLGNTANDTQGKMYLCRDASIVKTGSQYGAEHMHLSSWIYNEENRTKPPYDGGTYANCSILHNNNINHPLLPRNDRCISSTSFFESLPVMPEGYGVFPASINSQEQSLVRGMITRVVN